MDMNIDAVMALRINKQLFVLNQKGIDCWTVNTRFDGSQNAFT